MDMSYREKTTWISLAATLLIFGFYFVQVIRALIAGTFDTGPFVALFIVVVVLFITIEVTSHILITLASKERRAEAPDEREQLIELKSTRNAHYLLVFGVGISACSMIFLSSTLLLANIILFFFVCSEIAGFASQLYYSKQGI